MDCSSRGKLRGLRRIRSTQRLRQVVLLRIGHLRSRLEFRGAQLERWFAARDHTTNSDEYRRTREETHRTGAAAQVLCFEFSSRLTRRSLSALHVKPIP